MGFPAAVNNWYLKKIGQMGLGGRLLRKSRRFYLGVFNPKYIETSIHETRRGDCNRCGACCKLIFKCPFLGVDATNNYYCRVYGGLRPTNCRTYPFDKMDAEIKDCSYRFE